MQPDKAGTAPAFPADHLAGAKANRAMDTKDGLKAWAAIRLLFPEPEPEPEPERSDATKWMYVEDDKRLEEWRTV